MYKSLLTSADNLLHVKLEREMHSLRAQSDTMVRSGQLGSTTLTEAQNGGSSHTCLGLSKAISGSMIPVSRTHTRRKERSQPVHRRSLPVAVTG